MKQRVQQFIKLTLFIVFVFITLASASDLTSTSFIIRDPVIGAGGAYGTSASYKLYTSTDLTMIGRGTSASYEGRYGFLWYPYVTIGAFAVNLVGTTANLTWGASTAGLGWNVAGYNVGYSAVSGGPYSYTNVGNVTSTSYPNLAPGQYCYTLQTYDAFGNVIATSPEQCVTVTPSLTFAISANNVQFGGLSAVAAKYATTSGGSLSNIAAHTITASSNAPNGYSITYKGGPLTSGANTIAPGGTTIGGDADGTQGVEQFALSLDLASGSGSVPNSYLHAGSTWGYVPNATTQVASANIADNSQYNVWYLANISPSTPDGTYQTAITYVLTGNF